MPLDPEHPGSGTVADFALMETQSGAIDRYWRLAVETVEYQRRLKAAGVIKYSHWIDAANARIKKGYLLDHIPQEHHDRELFSRWDDWASEFDEIERASPKWRLKCMISEVSETHSCCGWPNRWEKEIWNWALSDERNPSCPFDDRRRVLDPGFRRRLRGLITETGGFLYRCEETQMVIFAPGQDLPRIWRHQEHLDAIDRNRPFGFLHDASRPNYRMRAPTLEEENALTMMRSKALEKAGGLARLTRRLRRLSR